MQVGDKLWVSHDGNSWSHLVVNHVDPDGKGFRSQAHVCTEECEPA